MIAFVNMSAITDQKCVKHIIGIRKNFKKQLQAFLWYGSKLIRRNRIRKQVQYLEN